VSCGVVGAHRHQRRRRMQQRRNAGTYRTRNAQVTLRNQDSLWTPKRGVRVPRR
jgi:hypothetical protein